MKQIEIAVDLHETDGFTLSAIIGGYLVQQRFIDYSIREAKRLFIERHGGRK